MHKVNESPADFGQHALGDTGDVVGGATAFAKVLREIRERAAVLGNSGPQKKQPDLRLFRFIIRLGEFYQETTGKAPRRSTGSIDSKPGGPFFRLVEGAYVLGGIHKTDEAIAQDIRRARKAYIAPSMDS